MKLRACGSVIFVRPDAQPNVTTSGLHLVYEHQQSTMRGTVIAVGDGPELVKRATDRLVNYVRNEWDSELADQLAEQTVTEHVVDVGDRVIFSPDSGEELQFEQDTLIAMREDQVLAIIDGD